MDGFHGWSTSDFNLQAPAAMFALLDSHIGTTPAALLDDDFIAIPSKASVARANRNAARASGTGRRASRRRASELRARASKARASSATRARASKARLSSATRARASKA